MTVTKDVEKLNEKRVFFFLENVVFKDKIFTHKALLSPSNLNVVKQLVLLYENIHNPDGTLHINVKKLKAYRKHGICPIEIPDKFEAKKKRPHDGAPEKTKASKRQKNKSNQLHIYEPSPAQKNASASTQLCINKLINTDVIRHLSTNDPLKTPISQPSNSGEPDHNLASQIEPNPASEQRHSLTLRRTQKNEPNFDSKSTNHTTTN